MHEALTLHMAKWPKVLCVLQNALAQRQDQGSASNVSPLPLLFVNLNGRDQEVQDIINAVVTVVLDTQVQSS